jgi:hypothetical protein
MHATTAQAAYNARVLVISVGGAIVVGTGLLYTARNYRLSRRGQVTDRFTVALERLGSSELYVRIGGVYALEHVMRDSADHHDDVIEVLTEFIRDRAPRIAQFERHVSLQDFQRDRAPRIRWMHPVTGSVPDLPYRPTADIQAALTALGHRPHRPERQAIDLRGLHLSAARLGRANLTGARLQRTDLTDADLTYANLTRAELHRVNLTNAQLWGANLTGALGTIANLTHARLYKANLTGVDFCGADLTGVDFGGADLTGVSWPSRAAVPVGWERGARGKLKRSKYQRPRREELNSPGTE